MALAGECEALVSDTDTSKQATTIHAPRYRRPDLCDVAVHSALLYSTLLPINHNHFNSVHDVETSNLNKKNPSIS